ncbi:MAG: glycoside hydrolase [Sphingobacteriales bacterium]|nr:MAG: glycoside hydrolase [Sphingobacteriales bacterium]
MRVFTFLVYLTFSGCFAHIAAQQKHIYIANDDHTDYLWSADVATYQQAFLDVLDYYLDLNEATATNPVPYQNRYNCDAAFWVYTYKKYKTPTEFQRLIDQIQSGHVTVPLNMMVATYGGQSAESIIRGMYWQGKLEREYNLDLNIAISMENQTHPLGLASLWAGSGANYSWKGVCGCASPVSYPELGNRTHEIYQYKGPDSTGVLMKWYSLDYNQGLGGYAEAWNPNNAVGDCADKCNTVKYPYWVAGGFGRGWDNLTTFDSTFPTVAQSNSNATQQVYVSNETDFFEHFNSLYGNNLPTECVTYGNDWDTDCASLAEVTANVKRMVEKLRSAEVMATLVATQNPAAYPAVDELREKCWVALGQYWEHNFGLGGCCGDDERANWQRELADDVAGYVNQLYAQSLAALGSRIQKTGTNLRFFVLNPLNWTRTDVADFDYTGSSNIKVIDLQTGQETPFQMVTVNGSSKLRILAQNIPSIGYKTYEVQAGAGISFPNAITVTGNLMENEFYRLTVTNAGVITSLQDKLNGNTEYCQAINSKYINDLGSGNSNTGTLSLVNNGAVSATFMCTSTNPIQHTTLITLYKDINRIDLQNTINASFGDNIRTYSFSFNLTNPTTHHEELGAILKVKNTSSGGHYAMNARRHAWQTLNHFADVGIAGRGITLSNADAGFMKIGSSTTNFLDETSSQINVLAGGRMAGSGPGIFNQHGDTQFLNRFALHIHNNSFNQATAMKWALEHQNPLICGIVGGGTTFPETMFSYLSVSDPNVVLWTLKPSEEGVEDGGIIARLWNLSTTPSVCTVDFTRTANSATRATHIETDLLPADLVNGNLTANLGQQQMQTYRIYLGCNENILIEGEAVVCSGNNQYTYSVASLPYATYNWQVSSGGDIIQGQGTSSITVQWNSGTLGTVSVEEIVP